jgi:hypothetical protein
MNRRASSAVFNPADAMSNNDLNNSLAPNKGDAKPIDSNRRLIYMQPVNQQAAGTALADDDSEEEMESENEENGEN